MNKKYIFCSLILFSAYNYNSERKNTSNNDMALISSNFFSQRAVNTDGNNFKELADLQQKLSGLCLSEVQQQDSMHFYSLPSQTCSADRMILTPQEIAQKSVAASSGWFTKIRSTVTAMVIGSELKLSLAEIARHGHFSELVKKDTAQFAQDFQDEVGILLTKFQENNRKQEQTTNEVFRARIENNKQIIRDLNDILVNLLTIKFLKDSSIQAAVSRSLKDIETNLKRQLEINKATVERTMQESSDIVKILNDLPIIKQKLCQQEQKTDLIALLAEADTILNSNTFKQ